GSVVGREVADRVVPANFLAIRASCGQSHTVLVSTDGEAWVCGRNRSGQLGLDPCEVSETSIPMRVPLFPPASDGSYTGRVSGRDNGKGNGNGHGKGN
ncbi:unnamed protein product, partial [Laminaria digitata]